MPHGLDDPKLALTLLAIEPGLKGVLIAGPSGTGKSVLARAARVLWPEGTPFVEVPLGVTMDRLVGGIDVERTLETGHPVVAPGLLAQAHGGVLYVDEINLLQPEAANVLHHTLATGQVRLEREGLSETHSAEFVLIGTFNPAEGPVSPALLDRVAFIVPAKTLKDVPSRAHIAATASSGRPQGSPLQMPPDVINMVEVGREVLNYVWMPGNALKELCAAATALKVESNRAEVFAVRCAKANTALNARVPITQGDIDLAVRLVLAPRATRHMEIAKPDATQTPTETPPSRERSEGRSSDAPKPDVGQVGNLSHNQADVKPMDEEEKHAPLGLLREPIKAEGGTAAGKRGRGLNMRRGRHIRSLPGRAGQGQLALVDTLKAAALNPAGRREGGGVRVSRDDVRIKQFRQRTGLLVIFAVDASGSMALNRINTAKAAAISLLQSAYVHRDKIALISFRRDRAVTILSPGGGVAKARRVLESLPTGGRTPLSAALAEVYQLAGEKACHLHVAGTVLVLITDARSNQPLRSAPENADRETVAMAEVERLSKQIRPLLVGALVMDTRRSSGGNGPDLARWLGGQYVHLPKAGAGQIAETVQGEMAKLR